MSNIVTVKTAHVNSKILFNEINEFIESGLAMKGVSWKVVTHRKTFCVVMDEWLEEFVDDGKITQFNVIGDRRVNQGKQNSNIFNVVITYKQTHCLNTTILEYRATTLSKINEELAHFLAQHP